MYIKILEASTNGDLENKVNDYLQSVDAEKFEIASILQSESMAEVGGKLERRITMTLIFDETIFGNFDEEDEEV